MTGAAAALPIASNFLAQVTPAEGFEPFPVPDGITEADVDSGDGTGDSECGTREVFLAGTEPAGGGCTSFVRPSWEGVRDWGDALARRARRLIEGLIARRRQWEPPARDH